MSTEHPLQHRWVLWEHKSVNNKSEEWANSMRIVCEFSSIEEFWTYWRFVPRPSEVLFDGSTRKGGQDAQFEMQKSNSDEATASLIVPLKATFHNYVLLCQRNDLLLRLIISKLALILFAFSPTVLFDLSEVEGRSIEAFSVFKKGIRPEWEDINNRSGSDLTCRKSFLPEQLDIYWENLVLALIGETIDEGDEICGCRVVDKSAKKGVQRTMFKLELWLRSANPETAEKMRVRMLDALSDGEASKENNRLKMPEFDFKKRN